MKDYENGGHCKRQNLRYNEKHLLLCVNTHGQFILLCSATGGYFSVSGGERRGRKPPCPNGSIQNDKPG